MFLLDQYLFTSCVYLSCVTLQKGYTFEAQSNGQPFRVTVPMGGVEEGQKFPVQVPSGKQSYCINCIQLIIL